MKTKTRVTKIEKQTELVCFSKKKGNTNFSFMIMAVDRNLLKHGDSRHKINNFIE